MKHLLKKIFFVLFFLPVFALAQKTHTVGPKETLFSIGRIYNVHPRELAAYNNIPFEQGLTMGQVIKIPAKTTMQPLATTNVVTKTTPEASDQKKSSPTKTTKAVETKAVPETLSPIYHVVQKKENLFQIRMQYNKVPMDSLKKWNNLTSDAVNEGTNLIVGYTKNGGTKITASEETKTISKPIAINSTNNNNTQVIAPTTSETNTQPKIKITDTTTYIPPAPGSRKYADGGFFKAQYTEQSKGKSSSVEESGKAGQFKSTSGWDDGMYYCLHNKALAGTIVKVTNKANKRFVYAKVLDVIPDINKNSELVLSISKAAAEELGATSETFDVMIAY